MITLESLERKLKHYEQEIQKIGALLNQMHGGKGEVEAQIVEFNEKPEQKEEKENDEFVTINNKQVKVKK